MTLATQYENSVRFRLLKWLHPILMTAVFAIPLYQFYLPTCFADLPWLNQQLLIIGYLALLLSFDHTYHALTVGLFRVTELLYSQFLANTLSIVFLYAAMSLFSNILLPPLPLIIILFIQMLLSLIWCLIGNRIYFNRYPAPRTIILYRNEADLMRIHSIRYFHDRFKVEKSIENPPEDIHELGPMLDGYEVVFVAGINATQRNGIAKYCLLHNIKGYFIPHLGDIIIAGAEHMSMFSEPVLKVTRAQTRSEYIAGKRIFDIVASALGLIIISPVMLITALAIKLYDGGPVFYQQIRLTQNGRKFSILKFRSMNVNAEKDGVARLASENDKRITPVGRIIRATRIDELPQLINILKGDMSLVGPRPERPEIAAEYAKTLPEFYLRLQVKAGLTGMAQVYGRYNTEPYTKLQMDLMYINNASMVTDIGLIFSTLKILFLKDSTAGVAAGQATAETHSPSKTA